MQSDRSKRQLRGRVRLGLIHGWMASASPLEYTTLVTSHWTSMQNAETDQPSWAEGGDAFN